MTCLVWHQDGKTQFNSCKVSCFRIRFLCFYLGLGFVFIITGASLFVLGLVILCFVYFLFLTVWLSVSAGRFNLTQIMMETG